MNHVHVYTLFKTKIFTDPQGREKANIVVILGTDDLRGGGGGLCTGGWSSFGDFMYKIVIDFRDR